jgi:hypothetical protein
MISELKPTSKREKKTGDQVRLLLKKVEKLAATSQV